MNTEPMYKTAFKSLPWLAEAVWRVRHPDYEAYPGYELNSLVKALPNWVTAVQNSRIDPLQEPKRVAIFAVLRWWVAHAASLGMLLAGLGHEVSIFSAAYRDWRNPDSRYNLRQRREYLRSVMALGSPVVKFTDLSLERKSTLPPALEAELFKQSLQDVQYSFQREDIDLEGNLEHAQLMSLRLERNTKLASALIKSLKSKDYDVLIVPNGSILEFGAAYHAARYLGIPVVTYEFGEQRERVWLAQNDEVMRHDTSALWSIHGDQPLGDPEIEKLEQLFAARRGAKTWLNFARQWQAVPSSGTEDLRQKLNLEANKPIALLCTNVVGDSLALGRQVFSEGMADWLKKTAQFFAARPDAQLVVRVHPGELLGAGQPSVEVIESVLPELPEHVLVIPPEAEVNTYDLIKFADLGLVYTTTVGLEMALTGLPVIVSGQTHYRGRGFTFDPDNWEEYFGDLSRLLDPNGGHRLSADQTAAAWRYAHLFFFEFPRPFPWHLVNFWSDMDERPMDEVLKPENLKKYRTTLDAMVGEDIQWGDFGRL